MRKKEGSVESKSEFAAQKFCHLQQQVKQDKAAFEMADRVQHHYQSMQPEFKVDFRCEFDLPKFCDLRSRAKTNLPKFSMALRSQKGSIFSSALNRNQSSTSIQSLSHRHLSGKDEGKTSLSMIQFDFTKSQNNHKEQSNNCPEQQKSPSNESGMKVDENFEWFQEPHDFKILSHQQLMRIKNERIQPKLNSTMPIPETGTSLAACQKQKTHDLPQRSQNNQRKHELSKPQTIAAKKRTLD